jgi:acetyl esterase
MSDDEGVLDPYLTELFAAEPGRAVPFDDFSPEVLELARGPFAFPVTREIAHVRDEHVDGIPIRIYHGDGTQRGLVVYFHGGGFVIGSIGIMDNVARELAHAADVVVISVGYRLAPEHPYPEGLDDCEAVTRWAHANAARFGVSDQQVFVAGESAGGNLSAAVALRLRGAPDISLAGQILIYPVVAGSVVSESMKEFDGLVLSLGSMEHYWQAYSGGRDLDDDPFAAPLSAPDLTGLPPALVLLGGCDLLRDEGRAYGGRLRDEGVDIAEICYPGQPHGFVNLGYPAAEQAFADIGTWLRSKLADDASAA